MLSVRGCVRTLVLAPDCLLDFLRFFAVGRSRYANQKFAGYHYLQVMHDAIMHVVAASRPEDSQKGGVVWHTQRQGKSITMTCLAARVMRETAMENPTIVIITDRNDLDGQLFGVFSLSQDILLE